MQKDLKIGIVGFSFALEPEEPNKRNKHLACRIGRTIDMNPEIHFLIGAQWEVGLGLEVLGLKADLTVDLLEDGRYLGSEEVWEIGFDKDSV